MKPSEFVSKMAQVLGIEETELTTVSKALAAAGLRRRGQGRYPPPITPREGLRILIGVMAARRLVRAADDVAQIERFRTHTSFIEVDGDEVVLPDLVGLTVDDLDGMTLIDALERISRQLADATSADVEVRLMVGAGLPATVVIEGFGASVSMIFTGTRDNESIAGDMRRVAEVGTRTLRFIGDMTREA
ncbi:hypothetical protein GCM10011358_13640 [Sinisalibacter lacisalsi]|uniref:HTH merR-type domain-containing protein n=2 Tax=Sinisalibacter lacisalsi TaxID=1526570 RepID=A0ABQ1QKW5_9RHOB|nr:hypothetical protein GCM10011358_13640 [Sinisalibacter lacisalsi]